jgi:hypothetical protein
VIVLKFISLKRLYITAAAFVFSALICIIILPAKVGAEDWGAGGLTASEATVTITDSSTGTLTVPAGMSVSLGGTASPSGELNVTVESGASVSYSGVLTGSKLNVSGAGNFTLAGGSIVRNSAGTNAVNAFDYNGSGTLTLSGTQITVNSYSNCIGIYSGTATFVMTGGSLSSQSSTAMMISDCASATFSGGTIQSTSSAGIIFSGGTTSITASTNDLFTVKGSGSAVDGAVVYSGDGLITASQSSSGTNPTYAVGSLASYSYRYLSFGGAIPNFSLTVENGTGSNAAVSFSSQADIEATTPAGYTFVRWSVTNGDYVFADDTVSAQTITMPYSNLTLTPVFEEISAPASSPSVSSSSSNSSSSDPVLSEIAEVIVIPVLANETTPEEYVSPKVVIADDTPIVVDGNIYSGTVKVESVDSDKPQEIPKEVIIDGERYIVGDTIYIVGTEEKVIEASAQTGFSYVVTAVENSSEPVKFTAEGLPDGLEISEDGVITTSVLPAPVGSFVIIITADNGLDTHTYEMTIEIKEGGLSDEELIAALTENDVPELLTEPQETVHNMWVNEDLKIHYEPEIDDFYALFLDGRLLIPNEDYLLEIGSTVIVLTEQTMAQLPAGDHVVTTMFNQNSNVGLDTVINDVGTSSYVFRFGDEKTTGKRVNIGGDGVTGSVTYDDESGETPVTTISSNTKAIEERAANLSNATGREIIAAFETIKHGGFGGGEVSAGKVATFAVSVKSLDLSLKNGMAVYVAVYDSTTGKTYQNKGEIKDGMIVFRTKHSGIFMVALEKF